MQLNKYTLLLQNQDILSDLSFSNVFQFSKADFPKSCIYAGILASFEYVKWKFNFLSFC